MKINLFKLLLFIVLPFYLSAQQTVRGIITDKDSKETIPFANILIKNVTPLLGTISDENGKFILKNVPIGKQTLIVTFLGYETITLSNLNVTSGKEVVLNIGLIEDFEKLDEVIVVGGRKKEETVNEFSSVSARSLNIEDANLYAASFGDPARQVQNFAGVTGNGDDLNNEIVIRGNSPNTVLWRLEGAEIPNPNHFVYSTGGAVSMLSSNVLDKTDFFTSAFPAEYGNGLAGVFDLRFRKGNNKKRETTIDAGFLGLGIASEGYFNKKSEASYLLNYRYSTASILESLGVNLSEGGNLNYQDLNYNIYLPTSKIGEFNVYGLYGKNTLKSSETASESEDGNPTTGNFQSTSNNDVSTFIAGIGHRIFLKDRTYLKTNISYSSDDADIREETKNNGIVDPLSVNRFDSKIEAFRLSSFINHKFNSKNTIRTGINLSHLKEKTISFHTGSNDIGHLVPTKDEANGNSNIFQSYVQWKHRATEKLTLNTGIHFLHFAKTKSSAVEPRIGLNYKLNSKHSLSLGAGLHSRAERLTTYFIKADDNTQFPNTNLKLSKALHYVLGYNWKINKHTHFKAEAYYQNLFNIPVDNTGETGFNVINARLFDVFNITDIPLTNEGKGRNYGIEFTLERFVNNGFYYLTTLSLYDSKYKIGNSNYYNTRFNGNYVFNFLSGKEFKIRGDSNKILAINSKFNLTGGQRFTAINREASIANQTEIYSIKPFTEKVKDYYRLDIGVNYQWNKKNTTHNLSLNIQNVTNKLNKTVPEYFYDDTTNKLLKTTTEQNGLLPVLKYSINF